MKNRIKHKLTSSDGISVLFGLLFFLVAAILSAVMLSASVTAIKSVMSDKKSEQNYLTCSSAATTIRDTITDIKVTETKTDTKKNNNTTTTYDWTTSTSKTTTQEFGEKYLMQWLEAIVNSPTKSDKTSHTITINGTQGMEDVKAEVILEKDDDGTESDGGKCIVGGNEYYSYDMSIVFTTGEGVDSCKLTLSLAGKISGSYATSNNNKTTTTTLEYTWTSANIMYGDTTKEAGS